ncbi:MAG TPA: hypothetical protein VEV17_13945 [Bryobacteraceae bacterium]|nr:hypothetical protein [Bryobacteraceae bacterium]
MKRWNLPIALYLFVVFVSGAVVGALGYRTYNPPSAAATPRNPEEFRKRYLDEIKGRVGLNDEQLARVNTLLDETRTRFHDARDKHNDIVKEIGEDYRAKVRLMLTPEQLPKYEAFWRERDQRQKQQNKR